MTKSKINTKRLLLGGVVAGAILFVITGIVNGAILSGDLEGWLHGMSGLVHPPTQAVSMSLWAVMCLIYGMVGLWIYAGIRPRYGASHGTAMRAGFLLWLGAKLAVAIDLYTLGIFPTRILAGQLIGSFVGIELALLIGASVYQEK